MLGATGFLGAHVVAAAAGGPVAKGKFGRAQTAGSGFATVIAASRRPERAGELSPARVFPAPRRVAIDCTESRALVRALDEHQPQVVLSLAALSRAAACEEHPAQAQAVNADAPRCLAAWCRRNAARLVHVSTDLVFGERPPAAVSGFLESEQPAPLSVYGRTKLAGEAAVLEEHCEALVVRLPLLFGPAHGRALGASQSVVRAAAEGHVSRLFVDEWRTPLDVRDAAAALLELALGPAASERGVLHVAGPQRLSRYELGLLALQAAGFARPATLLRATRQAELAAGAPRPADVSLDARRAKRLLETRLRAAHEALGIAALP